MELCPTLDARKARKVLSLDRISVCHVAEWPLLLWSPKGALRSAVWCAQEREPREGCFRKQPAIQVRNRTSRKYDQSRRSHWRSEVVRAPARVCPDMSARLCARFRKALWTRGRTMQDCVRLWRYLFKIHIPELAFFNHQKGPTEMEYVHRVAFISNLK